VTVFVRVKARPVIRLFEIPGPVSKKSCVADLFETVIVYLPGLSLVTFFPAFLSVIVSPGPVVPVSLPTEKSSIGRRQLD
jgi:hypothetical protein